MKTDIYFFQAAYDGLEEKIWRVIEVSGRYMLNRLGYCVLATFETQACHLFSLTAQGRRFVIPSGDAPLPPDTQDMASLRLEELCLKLDDTIDLVYESDPVQTFHLKLLDTKPIRGGRGLLYPYVSAGSGRGIIEGLSTEELGELVRQIRRSGRTDRAVYYNDRPQPWDYRDFAVEPDYKLLKKKILQIDERYQPYWEH